ncbi:metallophosphoesterase [Natrarchaeobius halalkaliphilus]|uniref:Metallophosphoesterase n=1 Tax=Natrarchaeobius halalkaliphilus TaxID=1679091 RepID=A0A3N6LW17_9EURY|nr:metallophosphoesterase [Natrarchaeobius halalkaliphilus]RQG92997.1 metallophosphoesterase [Natrarchaeobius halalkaliphilus]
MEPGTAIGNRDPDIGPFLARLRNPLTSRRTRIAIVADLHLSSDADGTWKLLHRTERGLETAIEDVNARDVDGVVFAGDLTASGAEREFRRFEELVEDLEAPWIAIPGNHDVRSWDGDDRSELPTASWFASSYADGSFPVVARFGGVDLVGLNSASTPDDRLTEWSGDVSDDQLEALRERLPALENPLVVCHHTLRSVPETPAAEPWEWFTLDRSEALVDVLTDHDVPLVVSAHHHLPAASVRDGLREVISPAVCSFPRAYSLLEIDERGTTIQLVPCSDREGLTEAYWHARTGEALGQGVLEMACSRLDRLPLLDEWAEDDPAASEVSR